MASVFVVYYAAGGDVYDVAVRDESNYISSFFDVKELKDLLDLLRLKPGVIDNIPLAAEYDARINIFLNERLTPARKAELYAILDKSTDADRFQWVEILPPPDTGLGSFFAEYSGQAPPAPPALWTVYVDP